MPKFAVILLLALAGCQGLVDQRSRSLSQVQPGPMLPYGDNPYTAWQRGF